MIHRYRSMRKPAAAAAAVIALANIPGAIMTIPSPGVANADVCAIGPSSWPLRQ